MKKKYQIAILLAALTLSVTCIGQVASHAQKAKATKQKKKPTKKFRAIGQTFDTLSLGLAQHYIANLNTFFSDHNIAPSGQIHAYTIHAEDLFAALGVPLNTPHPQCSHIRVYLGMNDNSEFKLFVVGVAPSVDSIHMDGPDLLFNLLPLVGPDSIPYDSVCVSQTPDAGAYVMDLNAPCPPTCDTKSPLMNIPKGDLKNRPRNRKK